MFQHILPVGLIAVIRSLSVDPSSLKWNLETDGNNASVTLQWKISDGATSENFATTSAYFGTRRKPPSTLTRDEERRMNFLRYGSWSRRSSATNNFRDDVRTVCTTTEVSNCLKVSALVQTDTIQNSEKSVQAGSIASSVECSTQTNISNAEKSLQTYIMTSDTATSTDHPPTLSAAVQTDPEFETATVTPSTSSLHVASHVNMSACKDVKLKLKNETEECSNSVDVDKFHRKTELVLKRRIKGPQVEYLIKWENKPPNNNSWVPEDKLDSVALTYIEKNLDKIRGLPLPQPPPVYTGTQNHHLSRTRGRTTDSVRMATAQQQTSVAVVDHYDRLQMAVKIVSKEGFPNNPREDNYRVLCKNGQIAKVYVQSTPLDFEDKLGWN